MNRKLNDLRQKDLEIFNLWAAYQAACREYERCREGGDPSRCDQWPAAAAPTP